MTGRIFGLYGAAYSSFLPIGMVVFGVLADRTSMRLLMMISGGLLILMAAVMFLDKSFYRHSSDK
jgi:DHA3 family macrolide efflux protein-like MFS transporter